jgi:medium-chain acyl-[acyl-carrier-protein] hydrolase
MTRTKLFCFPYAGGSATVYNRWRTSIDANHIELIPVELAGRGTRINEGLYENLEQAIGDLFNIVSRQIHDEPYAFFGHSMGAMLCYELTHRLIKKGYPLPKHLFISGRGAPHIERINNIKYHLLEGEEFKQEVVKLGGTPKEFFEQEELVRLFLPMLKNDFRLAELSATTEILPLDIAITALFGKNDDLSDDQCAGWRLHTHKLCVLYYFNGGHFFIHDEVKKVTSILNNTLKAYITKPGYYENH